MDIMNFHHQCSLRPCGDPGRCPNREARMQPMQPDYSLIEDHQSWPEDDPFIECFDNRPIFSEIGLGSLSDYSHNTCERPPYWPNTLFHTSITPQQILGLPGLDSAPLDPHSLAFSNPNTNDVFPPARLFVLPAIVGDNNAYRAANSQQAIFQLQPSLHIGQHGQDPHNSYPPITTNNTPNTVSGEGYQRADDPTTKTQPEFHWVSEDPSTQTPDRRTTAKAKSGRVFKQTTTKNPNKLADKMKASRIVPLFDNNNRKCGAYHTLGGKQQPRTAFTPEKRKQTALTRKIGACIRCRHLGISCVPTQPNADESTPCKGCETSRPYIWTIPCIRTKIKDSILFRPGPSSGHPLEFRNAIAAEAVYRGFDSSNGKKVTLQLTQGIGSACLSVQVSEFTPQDTDKTGYAWSNGTGRNHMEMPPYQLADLESAMVAIKNYIESLALVCLLEVESPNPIVWETIKRAIRYAQAGQKPLVGLALQLWVACRLIEKPWRIYGIETLGVEVIQDTSNPWNGTIPIPPIMDHQLDQLIIRRYLMPLRSELLKGLQKIINEGRAENWMEVFLVVFILLHNTEKLLSHSRAMARRFGIEQQYFSSGRSKSYIHTAEVLLAHFRIASKRVKPLSLDWSNATTSTPITQNLDENHYMQKISENVDSNKSFFDDLRSRPEMERDLYWWHRMFLE